MIHAVGRSFLSTLRQLCSAQLWEATSAGNSAGCQVTFKAVWSKSARSSRRTEAALWALPHQGSAQPGQKGWPLSATRTRAWRKLQTLQVSFPISKCPPNISSYRVIGFSSLSFLRGLTVLHPNSYLEKAATSQIKLRRSFLAPESDRGSSVHPTNQSQQPRHTLTRDGKPDLRGRHSKGSQRAFFLLNTHTVRTVNK